MDIKQLYNLYQQHPCITTDSRDCPEGSIFIALKGAAFDGNKFAAAAIGKGCAYAIIDDREVYEANPTERFILVDDCLQTYKDLAREHRRQFHIPIIGITGTNGKTTTKELIAAVLSEKYNVLYTQGNFNNDVGVPKTLFRLNTEHEIAVIEMGASHPGDIKTLVETVEPTCGLITNVGMAHLQGFGSFDGVKKTKGELYDYLQQNGCQMFLNVGNKHLTEMAANRGISNLYGYGTDTEAKPEVWGQVVACDPMLRFQWAATDNSAPMTVETHLIGSYNIDNMLAAAAIGRYFHVTDEQICHALSSYIPSNNRSQMDVTEHNHLIVDAYNANPSSMTAAIENFILMQVEPKMAILGDMRELGEASAAEHQKIVDLLGKAHLANVWLVGEEFGKTRCAFRKFKDAEEVKAEIAQAQPKGYYILIKGSNGIKLYQLPPLL